MECKAVVKDETSGWKVLRHSMGKSREQLQTALLLMTQLHTKAEREPIG